MKNTNTKNISAIKVKKTEIEVLEEVYDFLSEKLTSNPFVQWKCVGKKDEQDRDWRTDELLWEDEEKTIPKMRDRYDNVTIPESEYTDDMWTRKQAIENLMAQLDKLV